MPGAAVRPHQGLSARVSRFHQCRHHPAARGARARHRSVAETARRAEGLDGEAQDAQAARAASRSKSAVSAACGGTSAVDLRQFPAPIWHRHDGGPFIGSGSHRHHARPGRRLDQRLDLPRPGARTNARHHPVRPSRPPRRDHRQEILGAGKPCPVAVVNGEDPALFIAGFEYLPAGHSEYEFAGAIKGAPIEVCPGPQTGLPLPAHAEIILEGASAAARARPHCRKARSASSPAITPPKRGRAR